MTKQEQFERLQNRWRAAEVKASEIRFELRYKYGQWYSAPRAKRERMEKAQKREEAASDAIFAWLDLHSPRQWRTGVPANWVCSALSYADAMTTGQMSVIPPVCYGAFPSDSVRFAMPIVNVA